MSTPRRGEVWWGDVEGSGSRPFLVMTRDAAIDVMHSVVAAPLTRSARGIPSELSLGPEDGVPQACVASFDNLRVVRKAWLTRKVTGLSDERMVEACAALRAALAC